MYDIKDIASIIYQRYQRDFGKRIDEMKLHKLLYLSQREAIILVGKPLFGSPFKAWRYGPVMVDVRQMYKSGELEHWQPRCDTTALAPIFDSVFSRYAGKDSWSLSSITHGEYCWQRARAGIAPTESCDADIMTDDIRVDAQRVKLRRILFPPKKSESQSMIAQS